MEKIIVARAVVWHPKEATICLIQNPPFPIKKAEPNLWTLPGGKVEESDCLIETAIREIMEETGLHVGLTDLLAKVDKIFTDEPEVMSVTFFFVGVSENEKLIIDPNDDNPPSDIKWINAANIDPSTLTYPTKKLWPNILKLKRPNFLP